MRSQIHNARMQNYIKKNKEIEKYQTEIQPLK